MIPSPTIVADQGHDAKEQRDHQVPIGQPGRREVTVVTEQIEHARQARDPRTVDEPPVQQRDHTNHGGVPQNTVKVHQPNRVGKQPVVQPVRQASDRPPVGHAIAIVRPPGQVAIGKKTAEVLVGIHNDEEIR